jgi:anterior pharynx defective protein 1
LRKAEVGLKKLTESDTAIITNKNILAYGTWLRRDWHRCRSCSNLLLLNILVSGLGFGIISGTFSLVNVLADATGPGTVGLHGDSNLFFLTSALLTLCFILLHTAWGVLFFHALDKKKYLALVWVVMSHLLVSLLVIHYFSLVDVKVKSLPNNVSNCTKLICLNQLVLSAVKKFGLSLLSLLHCSFYVFAFQTLMNSSQLYLATILPAYAVLVVTGLWAAGAAGASFTSLKKCLTSPPTTVQVRIED